MVSSNVCGTTAVLSMGRVSERVVVRDGQPAVRLMATLSCSGDHKLWDGQRVGRFFTEIVRIFESGELLAELPGVEHELARARAARAAYCELVRRLLSDLRPVLESAAPAASQTRGSSATLKGLTLGFPPCRAAGLVARRLESVDPEVL
jgi:hypothetical protein